MGFLHRNHNNTSKIDANQRAFDAKTEAGQYIDETIQDFTAHNEHLWSAPEATQVRLAQAALAACSDHIAESLRNGIYDKKGRLATQLPSDVALFADNLTTYSAYIIGEVKAAQNDYEFSDENREALYPDNQLLMWPVYPSGSSNNTWQSHDSGIASPAFVRGIVGAGNLLYTESELTAGNFANRMPAATPANLTSVPDILQTIRTEAFGDIQQASELLATPGNTPDEAYDLAHSGLIKVMHATMALVAPPMLGPDFRN